jgi:serine/threonine protein kinase
MGKFGENLGQILNNLEPEGVGFSLKTVAQIGIQLIDRLEVLHKLGFVHLDLKPDNICVQLASKSFKKEFYICLIDFGISK